jgi:hypothetical protein
MPMLTTLVTHSIFSSLGCGPGETCAAVNRVTTLRIHYRFSGFSLWITLEKPSKAGGSISLNAPTQCYANVECNMLFHVCAPSTRLRAELAAKLMPGCFHLPGLSEGRLNCSHTIVSSAERTTRPTDPIRGSGAANVTSK